MSRHGIVHVEIPAADPAASGQFYASLFGWNIMRDDQFDYTMFQAEDGPGGGFTRTGENHADGEQTKPGDVIVYVSTDDIDSTLAQVEALGGKTLAPKMEIPGTGWLALFSDPAGNKIGLYTAMEGQR